MTRRNDGVTTHALIVIEIPCAQLKIRRIRCLGRGSSWTLALHRINIYIIFPHAHKPPCATSGTSKQPPAQQMQHGTFSSCSVAYRRQLNSRKFAVKLTTSTLRADPHGLIRKSSNDFSNIVYCPRLGDSPPKDNERSQTKCRLAHHRPRQQSVMG